MYEVMFVIFVAVVFYIIGTYVGFDAGFNWGKLPRTKEVKDG